MLYTKNDLITALKNEIIQQNLQKITVDEIVIDSRKALQNKLFIALKGENNDGHNFLNQAFENGCEVAIIHDIKYFTENQNRNLILVRITFQSQAKTYATSGNLNNHYGLPLTLCNMPLDTEFAILEIGMNHLNEIEPLAKLAKPHLAVITQITSAHIGNFKNEDEIALAKSKIFCGLDNKGLVVINRDDKYHDFLKKRAMNFGVSEENIFSFGKNEKSHYHLKSIDIKNLQISEIEVEIQNKNEISYKIASAHKAVIFNSLIVVASLDLFNKINGLQALKDIEVAKGRGNVFAIEIAGKKIMVIDDSYNANMASMQSALEYLSDLKITLNKKRAIAILGDMFELGEKSAEIHEEVLRFVNVKSIDLLLLAGQYFKEATKILDKNFKIYLNSIEIALNIKNLIEDGDILLIKGSRSMKMEEALQGLIPNIT